MPLPLRATAALRVLPEMPIPPELSVREERLPAVPTMTLPPVLTLPIAARARRRIPPASGRALEILGHAIEYLADEYVLASGALPSIESHDPQIEAMQILMQANRAVYFECPVVPSWRVRLRRRILGPRAARV